MLSYQQLNFKNLSNWMKMRPHSLTCNRTPQLQCNSSALTMKRVLRRTAEQCNSRSRSTCMRLRIVCSAKTCKSSLSFKSLGSRSPLDCQWCSSMRHCPLRKDLIEFYHESRRKCPSSTTCRAYHRSSIKRLSLCTSIPRRKRSTNRRTFLKRVRKGLGWRSKRSKFRSTSTFTTRLTPKLLKNRQRLI